jgi:hypothetical protein
MYGRAYLSQESALKVVSLSKLIVVTSMMARGLRLLYFASHTDKPPNIAATVGALGMVLGLEHATLRQADFSSVLVL